MADYLLLYGGYDPEWLEKYSESQVQNLVGKWGEWFGALWQTGNLRSPGGSLEPRGKVLSERGNVVEDLPRSASGQLINGYTLIKADSLEEAVEIAKGAPIFLTEGGHITIRPIQVE